MTDEAANPGGPAADAASAPGLPAAVDRGQLPGTEFLMGYYGILDRAPQGRDEGDQPMSWLRRHDEYPSQ